MSWSSSCRRAVGGLEIGGPLGDALLEGLHHAGSVQGVPGHLGHGGQQVDLFLLERRRPGDDDRSDPLVLADQRNAYDAIQSAEQFLAQDLFLPAGVGRQEDAAGAQDLADQSFG